MQTVYYTTRNFIRSTGNVVDLAEYRRKLAQAEGSLAPAPRRSPPKRPAPSPACRWTVWPASACC